MTGRLYTLQSLDFGLSKQPTANFSFPFFLPPASCLLLRTDNRRPGNPASSIKNVDSVMMPGFVRGSIDGGRDEMSEAAKEFVKRLASLNQSEWDQAVEELLPDVHPVDQSATRIWFRFWPLRLCVALEKGADPEKAAQQLELDGNWDLGQQIDSSISFLYGARFWPAIKKAVLDEAHKAGWKGGGRLAGHFRKAAGQAASQGQTEAALTLGITAVAFMTLRQVGWEALSQAAANPASGSVERRPPQKVLKARQRKGGGLFDFLKGSARRHRIGWEEGNPEAHFTILEGQDISGAAAADSRDYRSLDPRRTEGPIPAQCRSAACGYCWIGILEGRESIDPISPFEQKRLHYFGYHPRDGKTESQPLIRLACQSKCRGSLTLVVPPWNGVLDGQR